MNKQLSENYYKISAEVVADRLLIELKKKHQNKESEMNIGAMFVKLTNNWTQGHVLTENESKMLDDLNKKWDNSKRVEQMLRMSDLMFCNS